LLKGLKTLLGGSSGEVSPTSGFGRSNSSVRLGDPYTRQSNGLDQFFASIRGDQGLRIVDFAGASQANISFITSLGHSISSEDYIRSLEHAFGDGPSFYENQGDPKVMDEFLGQNLNFPAAHFDGALVWDALQFLAPHLLQITVDRLYETLRPNASVLAFFHADEKAKQVALYHYRISDSKTLLLTPRGFRQQAQFFNNRALEKLFHRFQSVKFFLTRDSLREIIVRR
jgi:hypothetical protein